MNTKAAMRLTSSKRHPIYIAILLVVFSLAFVFVSDTYAVSLNIDVSLLSTGYRSHFYDLSADQALNCSSNCTGISSQTYPVNVSQIKFSIPSFNYLNGDIIQVFFSLENSTRNNSLDSVFRTPITASSNWELLSYDVGNIDSSSASIILYFRATANNTDTRITFSSYPNSVFIINDLQESLIIGNANAYRPSDPNAGSTAIINAINSQPNYTQSLNNIRNDIQGLQDAQEQANDDANDRYQDEKDTIDNNMSDAQDSVDSFNPSFSLPNPFTAFADKFGQQDCSTFPNLQNWLKWKGSNQICSPWPSSVKTVMNGVVTFLLTLVMTRFLVAWFKKNDTGD